MRALRILTYNVRRCVGGDGRADPSRIAEVIARHAPDIVALQELDVGRARTGHVDQAHAIAHHLAMAFHFHPAITVEEERYGDAILTALPVRLVKAGPLPGLPHRPRLEARGALWVAVDLGGGVELHVINTHLGLRAAEREVQVEALLGGGWLGHPECRGQRVVLLGDFNAMPRSRAYLRLAGRLRDAQRALPEHHRPHPTFPARWPMLRIDHVFLGEGIEALRAEVPRGMPERVASDHLPLVVDLRIATTGPA
ncbi:endonuclease/exonuclease/phosphatase family protein [Roseicella aerolata]|uniref:Endonuclease/exonuclease/phosphatase family protein n=1 Tax=Roseicella aerolata TaxID=2883479 RepID=A0A9X1IFN1_9PROT|nr:endonuclease/exonuclease/phosphatase family protein [Roseicella aerolata]MCB4823941.1 endonuclease/exonuclease/phosphatase family protein [Roseicella aerolata]